MSSDRLYPSPDPGTAPYWKAARDHKLMLPQCLDCGKYHSYHRALCPFCSSARLEWKRCSGHGAIYSFTEVFRAPSDAFAADVPYVIAIVELDEGPHLMTRLITADNKSTHVGQRVTVEFEDLDQEISLPGFKIDPA